MRQGDDRPKRYGFDDSINREIAEKLRLIRESTGLTQVEMAQRMGTSQKTIWSIENAIDNISLTKLSRYLKALDIEITMKFDSQSGKVCILCKPFTPSSGVPFCASPSGIDIASLKGNGRGDDGWKSFHLGQVVFPGLFV